MESLLHIGLSNAALAALLAVPAAAVTWLWRRPALAHSLWLLVLLKLLTPPFLPIRLPLLGESATALAVAPAEAAPHAEVPTHFRVVGIEVQDVGAESGVIPVAPEAPSESPTATGFAPPPTDTPEPANAAESSVSDLAQVDWPRLLGYGWLAGSVVWLGLAVVRAYRFRRMLRHSVPAPAGYERQAQDLARRMGLSQCPGVWMVPGRLSPMVWALGCTARLLLPAGLWERLTTEQRAALLLHELAHLRRRDHWVRWLELCVTALYWWHPLVWWARRELRQVEEECCDAWVIWAQPGKARAYATALLETLDFLSGSQAALPDGASGIGHIRDLKRRLTMIMTATTPRSLTWRGALGVLGLGAMLLPVLPTWAQEPAGRRLVGVEEEKPADPAKAPAAEDRKKEIDKLHNDIEQLTSQLAAARAQAEASQRRLAEVAATLEKARGRLGELESQPGQSGWRVVRPEDVRDLRVVRFQRVELADPHAATPSRKIIIFIEDGDGKLRKIEVPMDGAGATPQLPGVAIVRTPVNSVPPPALPSAAEADAMKKRLEELVRELEKQRQKIEIEVRPVPPSPAVVPPRRADEVDRRLDELIKEIEQLRKDLHRAPPATPAPQPGSPLPARLPGGAALPPSYIPVSPAGNGGLPGKELPVAPNGGETPSNR